jgi:hypothetical protein
MFVCCMNCMCIVFVVVLRCLSVLSLLLSYIKEKKNCTCYARLVVITTGFVTPEGPPHAPVGTGSIHRKLEKVKFLELFGALNDTATEAWLENMVI